MTRERERLKDTAPGTGSWKNWGPYLSERQWGTVREDYSPHGSAWDYFPHDHSRSRAYRWGEDGIGGVSDIEQRLCLSLALHGVAAPDPAGGAALYLIVAAGCVQAAAADHRGRPAAGASVPSRFG